MNRIAKNVSAAPPAGAATQASVSARGYIQCKVKANVPHDSHGTNGWIVGKSQFGCTARVDSVTNVVKLQKKAKGKWVDATKSKARNVKKPKAGTEKYRNQTRNYKCKKGTFRTASMGHGVYRGVPSKSRHWTYSKAVKNPCKQKRGESHMRAEIVEAARSFRAEGRVLFVQADPTTATR